MTLLAYIRRNAYICCSLFDIPAALLKQKDIFLPEEAFRTVVEPSPSGFFLCPSSVPLRESWLRTGVVS